MYRFARLSQPSVFANVCVLLATTAVCVARSFVQVSKGWQPNHTPPGGELVFEAYMVDGKMNVAAFFDIATPTQVSATPPERG